MRYVLLMALAFSGCAHVYSRPGATASDFQKDRVNCVVKANQAGEKNGPFFNDCMAGEGYTHEVKWLWEK